MGFYYPGMKSKYYWQQRMLDRDKAAKVDEDKLIRKINKIYRKVFVDLNKELDSFYNKYAIDNKLSLSEAKKQLSLVEQLDLLDTIENLKISFALTNSEYALEDLELLSQRRKVTRLQSLIDTIDTYLIETTNNVQITIEEHLSHIYTRSYKEALKDVGIKTEVINHRAVKEAVFYPLAGQMFSSRIWKNKKSLIKWIKKDLTAGIIRGDSIQKMGRSLKEKEKVTKYQAERLVRTETNYYMTHGHIDGYNDSNLVYGVEVIVAGDERTCPDCMDHETEVIKLSEVSYGDNVPPFHPNCRCSVVPILKDEI